MAEVDRRIGLFILFAVIACEGISARKSVLDYNDGDIERLYQQWEENDEQSENDDFMDKNRAMPQDFKSMLKDGKLDPQEVMKKSKKGKPVMVFVGVRGTPDHTRTEHVSARWMQSLQNAHIPVQRYIVADDRVLFMVEDGSLAWDVKNFLIEQTECTKVSFDQLSFDCKDDKKLEL